MEIKSLLEERVVLKAKLVKIETAIKAVQEVCGHDNTADEGHDSHYNYKRCLDCGAEIKT